MKSCVFPGMCALAACAVLLSACSGPGSESENSASSDVEAPLKVYLGSEEASLSYDRIAALPSQTFAFDDGAYFKGQEVTAVMMEDLWKAVDPERQTDTITAYCTDKYFSVYPRAFVQTYQPFVIIKVDGKVPSEWTGALKNASPYFISFKNDDSKPPYKYQRNKRPWGVVSVTFGKYDEMFSAFYSGVYEDLTGPAVEGREIWVNSCASCHQAAGNGIGGHRAVRPWEVLAVHASVNVDYFKNYVLDPKSVNPVAEMEAYPEYSDAQLDTIIAFLTHGP
ncbi:MAG: c-type cytochrome [Verrucomicrobiota bacterium]